MDSNNQSCYLLTLKNRIIKSALVLLFKSIAFLLVFYSFPALAVPDFNANMQLAYRETMKLRVENGRKLIQAELQENPGNACALLIANYTDFLTVVVSQNEDIYKKLRIQQEKRLEILARLKEESPYKRYAQAEIKLQLAMCEVFFEDEVKAAWHVRSAFLLLQENQKRFPEFIPNRKSLGLLQVIIGSVPDSYQWVFNILGMRGNINNGLENLRTAARMPNLFQTEAAIYLQFAHDWMNKKDTAGTKFMTRLAGDNPDNLLYTYLAMSMLKKNKDCDAALEMFMKRPKDSRYLPFAYLHHMAADMYLYKGQYQQSVQENRHFLKHYQGRHYLKDANFKLYLAHILSGDALTAQFYYSQILPKGVAVVEEDKYAQKFVENKTYVEPALMKARLHADGGYFQLALKALQNFDQDNVKNAITRTEFHYRKARIFQGLGQTDLAEEHYKKTIASAGNLPYYFAPNAALQLGYFAAEQQDKNTARMYFKKALSYPKHEYKNSIDSKAKIALSTL